jgi:hypothetical protein
VFIIFATNLSESLADEAFLAASRKIRGTRRSTSTRIFGCAATSAGWRATR